VKVGLVVEKGNGHKQMLGQATAMLVALPALLATEFWSVALAAFLYERLAVTCPPHASLLEAGLVALICRPIIHVVINCALSLHAGRNAVGTHCQLVGR
jgi:hypothetical protein